MLLRLNNYPEKEREREREREIMRERERVDDTKVKFDRTGTFP